MADRFLKYSELGTTPTPILPALSGMVHDFNFGDVATMVLSGNKITQITDAVGGAVSSQSDTGQQPILVQSSVPGVKPYALFNGGQALLGPLLNFSTEMTMLIVMSQGGTDDPVHPSVQGIFQQGYGDNGYGFASFVGANLMGHRFFGGYIPNYEELASNTWTFLSSRFFSRAISYTQTPAIFGQNYLVYDTNGSIVGGTNATDYTTLPTTHSRIGIGFGQLNFVGCIQRIICYDRALSQLEIQSVMDFFNKEYSLERPNYINFIGDSITANDYDPNNGNYPERIFAKLMPRNYFSFANKALSGDTSTGILGRLSTDVLTQVNPHGLSIFSMMIGHNDLDGGLYGRIVDICNQCKQVGYKIIIHTLLYSTGGSYPTYDTINNQLRSTWASFADALFDANQVPGLNDPYNTTYFRDGTHLTDAGSQVYANALLPVIQSLAGIPSPSTIPVVIQTKEAPTGAINGSNPTFTLTYLPITGSEMVFLGGALKNEGPGNDYTIVGNTITFLTAPSAGPLLVTYQYYN